MTKIYNPYLRRDPPAEAQNPGYDFRGLSQNAVQSVLDKLADRFVAPSMDPCVPICLTLDLSGSMIHHLPMIKEIVRKIVMELSLSDFRLYLLEIVVVHRSSARLVYFGDVRDLNIEKFIAELPSPMGMTHYAEALTIGMEKMDRVYKALESNGQYYNPCGVLLAVTDTLENADDTRYALQIANIISNAMRNGTRILAEFVTQSNQKGLVSGGYKVFIDQDTSIRQLERFVDALRVGSSIVNKESDDYKDPDEAEREEYNRFLANRLIAEMNSAYEKRIKPTFVRG